MTDRGRKTAREQALQNQAAMNYWADTFDKPRVAVNLPDAPKPRAAGAGVPDPANPLERDVQRTVMDILRWHPLVAFVGRFNRGVALDSNGDGTHRHTRFNTVPGFSDIHGMLRGGRAFYIEVKRPKGSTVSAEQRTFLKQVVAAGGLAGVARSADDALRIIEGRL